VYHDYSVCQAQSEDYIKKYYVEKMSRRLSRQIIWTNSLDKLTGQINSTYHGPPKSRGGWSGLSDGPCPRRFRVVPEICVDGCLK